ncbi:MAG: diadenylate cyclase CdaA [Oscillospiraceae bacterium]|nr:diadenylate cyclase CdaA [Oscillospiraceae bacterium]
MQAFFNSIVQTIKSLPYTFGVADILDIALVAYVIYQLIGLVKKTRAAQLMKGILVLFVGYFIADQIGMKTTTFIINNFLQFGLLALVVVFQPELRRALEQVGRSKLSRLSPFAGKALPEEIAVWKDAIVAVCDSAERMSKEKTGALMVIERKTGLDEIVRTGTRVDARVTSELLETIFYEGSPLHDGAVIISGGRVEAAGCILPVSSNAGISKDMGTRHRAALGMTESSDALVVVVSEETGIISLAQNGIIIRRLDRSNLHRLLQGEIIPPTDEEETGWRGFIGRFFKK